MGQFEEFAKEKATDNEPVWVDIVNRDGEPYTRHDGKPMQFQILGEYSEKSEEVSRRIYNRTMKRVRQGDVDFDMDESEEVAREKISAAVTGWTLQVQGKDVPFTKANLLEFLKVASWSAVRVRQDIQRHHRFFKKASAA